MLPTISGEFRLVDDPELRFTPSGAAVANVRLVANSRKKNEATGEWEDDKVLWVSGSVWRQAAENLVESCQKGDLVVVIGKIHTREYETKDGEKRSVVEVMIDEIGPSTRWSAAPVLRTERTQATRSAPASPVDDPWATPVGDEPPF